MNAEADLFVHSEMSNGKNNLGVSPMVIFLTTDYTDSTDQKNAARTGFLLSMLSE
jgi:hypothetical protein